MNKGKQWKWNQKIIKKLNKQGHPPLKLNHIDLSPEDLKILKEEIERAKQELYALKKEDFGEPNVQSGAEREREACKDKTIEEIWANAERWHIKEKNAKQNKKDSDRH